MYLSPCLVSPLELLPHLGEAAEDGLHHQVLDPRPDAPELLHGQPPLLEVAPETPHPPLVSASLTRVIVVDKVPILVDGKVCQVHELVMKLARGGRIWLSGKPEIKGSFCIPSMYSDIHLTKPSP